jgi:colanic acid/amylovoran biosynthesis protein
MKILIIGQTSLHWGRMEFGNIGNYYIIEPFIRELHKVFDNAEIKTTLQMSEQFCMRENIKVLPLELYYDFNSSNNLEKVKHELILVEEYFSKGKFKEKTPYIDEVLNADIVIDFSGDMWGDNANFLGKDRFEVGLYKDLIAQKLRPTFMVAGSPGPFQDERTKELAKEVYKNFVLVTNREPISTDLLKKEGFDVQNTKNLACPSFLFQPQFNSTIWEMDEFLKNGKPIVGFILCGWNFTVGPYDKWPRRDEDYYVFAEALEYLTNTYEINLVLMSHSNGFPIPPEKFKLQHGRDYPIIKQLENILIKRGKAKNFKVLNEVYTPHETKSIIKEFDMMISGRLHGAVAALSQEIPTVIIDYGHEPKAHKLKGIAELCEVREYLVDPNQKDNLIKKMEKCFNNRFEIKKHLEKRIPIVKQLAKENFIEIKNSLMKLGVIK